MTKLVPSPPGIFLRFFRWFCHPDLKRYIEGDLLELYDERLKRSGKFRADARFILDVLMLLRLEIIRPPKTNATGYMMYKSYFRLGWRNLLRNKLYSVIKMVGLSIGLTVCMLIFLYTKDEISFDRFHANKDRIFRITQDWDYGQDKDEVIGITNAIMGESFSRQLPEIEQYVRVNGVDATFKKGDDVFNESPLAVDSNFFSVFSFDLVEGNPRTALNDLHSIILSKEMAVKYFGTTDVIGKTLDIKVNEEFMPFKVTGLINRAPQNSTIKTDLLIPFHVYEKYVNNNKGWLGGSMNTFLMLAPGTDILNVENKMQGIFDKETKEHIAKAKEEQGITLKIKLGLQPLPTIHLSQEAGPDNGMEAGSNPVYSYLLTCIAIFILVIACINFVNLAIAQSMKRAREIGVRKVVGGTRKQLIRQFLTESFLVTTLSFMMAMVLTLAIIPSFNVLANKQLNFAYLADGYLFGGYFLLLLITSLIAGSYPALVLSSFQPAKVLYGRVGIAGKSFMTRGLIVVQFTLAIFLIIAAIVVNSQLNFLFHADLGYDSNNLVRIDLPVRNSSERLPGLFKNELSGNPDIVSVGARNGGRSISGVTVDGKTIEIENVKIDDQFLQTFRIPILAGRNVSPAFPSDSLHAVIVNESFIKEAGWNLDEAVGKRINFMDESKREATVVGVIRNYHFVSLHEKIKPELLSMNPHFNFGEIWVRINPAQVPHTIATLQEIYKKIVPFFPYRYQFMNDINAKNYKIEAKWKQIISVASVLFIFISCIGLFGLVGLSVENRTKEIGIRRVMGCAVSGIVSLISREFVALMIIAFVLAILPGYYAVHTWLETFAYRITPSWWMFGLGGLVVIAIALIVVCVRAIRAGLMNPVRNLRSE